MLLVKTMQMKYFLESKLSERNAEWQDRADEEARMADERRLQCEEEIEEKVAATRAVLEAQAEAEAKTSLDL